MPVMSVRLSAEEERKIRELAAREDKEKSKLARELMLDGLKFKMLLGYKAGRVSLSELGKALGMNVGQAVDFLSEFGLEAPISYDDYLAGAATARKAIR